MNQNTNPNGTLPPSAIITADARYYMGKTAKWLEYFGIFCYILMALHTLNLLNIIGGYLTGGGMPISEYSMPPVIAPDVMAIIKMLSFTFTLCVIWLNYYLGHNFYQASKNLNALADDSYPDGSFYLEQAAMQQHKIWRLLGLFSIAFIICIATAYFMLIHNLLYTFLIIQSLLVS